MPNTRRRKRVGGSIATPVPDPVQAALLAKTIAATAEDKKRFDLPRHVKAWLDEDGKLNQKMFFYGLGMILKDKEEEMAKKIVSIKIEIEKLTNEYKKNEENYQALLENDITGDLSEMKEDMQEKVRENLNIPYQARYSELIQKKQSYDVVVTSITNRRWYIAYTLQQEKESGKENEMITEIKLAVDKIYSTYRGAKYAPIREKLFSHLKTLAYSHSTYKNSFALNASITGPAGSGKTTLAREMAQWLSKIGLLTYDAFFEDKRGKLSLIETGRSGLIAEYTGQTAPKTLGVLVRSLERTLFIDEAYSVAGCSFDAEDKLVPDSYGEEFLAELLRFMNDHKGFTSLIVAGYDNMMKKCFFARNEGLPRRFPDQISLPFYSTDELFAIFTSTVVRKSQADIEVKLEHIKQQIQERESLKTKTIVEADKTRLIQTISSLKSAEKAAREGVKKQLFARFNFLSVIKPSFLMIHLDTAYDGINTLRKYLTIIQMRQVKITYTEAKELQKTFTKNLDTIYSWTILNHVLINLLGANDDSVRKHLFRRIFYEEVFNFTGSNLSYFPAQAGEMENLADDCSKRIAPLLSETQIFVDPKSEMMLINDYCKGKKIRVYVDERLVAGKFLAKQSGLTKEQEKQRKYVDEWRRLQEIYVKMPKKEENTGFSKPVEKIGTKDIKTVKGQIADRIAKLETLISAGKPASENSKSLATSVSAEPAQSIAYELCLLNTEVDDMRRRIHNFLELGLLFGENIPNLEKLWQMLLNKAERDKLIQHVVNLYINKITPEFIENILNETEKDFPIHLNRQSLELEFENFKQKINEDEDFVVSNGQVLNIDDQEKLLKKEKWTVFKSEMLAKIIGDYDIIEKDYVGLDNYAHKDYKLWLNTPEGDKLRDDYRSNILYEDLGIKE
jgi:hypothetical protein